jgi:tryptophan synthase alpha chain
MRAIAGGLDHARFFSLTRAVRRYAPEVPIGILLYANSLRHLGCDGFCRRAADAGIDSLLVADMPPEEAAELEATERRWGIASVYIASELTPVKRLRRICGRVTAFVYVVSRLGPTGAQSRFSDTVAETLRRLRSVTGKPLCVGFGLTRPGHIRAVARAGAHGAIVGSALVETIEKNLDNRARMLRMLRRQVEGYARAARPCP